MLNIITKGEKRAKSATTRLPGKSKVKSDTAKGDNCSLYGNSFPLLPLLPRAWICGWKYPMPGRCLLPGWNGISFLAFVDFQQIPPELQSWPSLMCDRIHVPIPIGNVMPSFTKGITLPCQLPRYRWRHSLNSAKRACGTVKPNQRRAC